MRSHAFGDEYDLDDIPDSDMTFSADERSRCGAPMKHARNTHRSPRAAVS